MDFRDRLGAREFYLHERCFYDGEYVTETIGEEIFKVKSYVNDSRFPKIFRMSSQRVHG